MFLFDVLFSVAFWVCYFLIGLVAGTVTMKRYAPKWFKFIIKDTPVWGSLKMGKDDYVILSIVMLFFYVIWPLPSLFFIFMLSLKMFFKIFFGKALWPLTKSIIIKIKIVVDGDDD